MLDVQTLRQQFPALQQKREGRTPIFLDGPAGTQVPQPCIQAIVAYLSTCNANQGGFFATSQESDRLLRSAHEGMAAFLNAPSADEIVFGPNMTTLTLHLSRSLGRTWKPGDEVIVTNLDHDANVTPWVLAARDAGATVRRVDIHPEDCTLNMADLQSKLSERTRLVAVTCASNLVGSLTDVAEITRLAHAAGALVFLDAVHYAPHALIDVQAWGCDFLVCSSYKFFGPHLGILWGKREHLEHLQPYKLRPAPEQLPHRWMTGTQNHECIAGLTGTLAYLAGLGQQQLHDTGMSQQPSRPQFLAALSAIREQEQKLAHQLLEGLRQRPRIKIWGIRDCHRETERVPTVAITHTDRSPQDLAQWLARRHIYSWSGHSYALGLTERLNLESKGGVLRLGLVHYNTAGEVAELLQALDELAL